jgi:hypothetical protein
VAPLPEVGVDAWLAQVDRILEGLAAAGLAVVPLSDLLGRPLMEARGTRRRPVQAQPSAPERAEAA